MMDVFLPCSHKNEVKMYFSASLKHMSSNVKIIPF